MRWITKTELIKVLLEMEMRNHNYVHFDLRQTNKEIRTKRTDNSDSKIIEL